MRRLLGLTMLFLLLFSRPILAAEPAELLDALPLENVTITFGSSSNAVIHGLDFKNLVWQAVRGELVLTPQTIVQGLLDSLLCEVSGLLSMLRHMLVIAVIGAVFRELSAAFKHKSAAEFGFYAQYLAILSVLFSSFTLCLGIMRSLIDELCAFMLSAQPVFSGLSVLGGNPSAAAVSAPILLTAINAVSTGIRNAIIPVISLTAVLQIVNGLSERAMLTKLTDLLRGGVQWALRMAAVFFVGLLALRRAASPALDTAVTKTAKLAVNAIPVVGAALSGAVDMVAAWTGVVRGGLTTATMIALALYCAAPLARLAVFTFMYKLTAGLMQPIADPRAVKAVDAAGNFAGLILGACGMVSSMFMVMAVIMLSA